MFSGTSKRTFKKPFMRRNKTAPFSSEQSITDCESLSQDLPDEEALAGEKSTQTTTTILDPLNLNINHDESYVNTKLIRPYTAPERSQRLPNKVTIINIPGQVPEQF